MPKQKYKVLYISVLEDDETGHKTTYYYLKRSKRGLTLRQILKPTRRLKMNQIMNQIMNMHPFEK